MKRLFALALLLPMLGGCFGSGKNPVKVTTPGPVSPYLVPSSPQAVLNNLIKSYTERDTTHYKQCYDVSYVGQSYSAYDTAGSYNPGNYSYTSEVLHIAALRRSTTVVHVSLTLPNYQAARMDTFPADPPGVVAMSIYNPSVQIDDASGTIAIATGEVFQFKFISKADSSSPTGRTWKIFSWTEIAPASP